MKSKTTYYFLLLSALIVVVFGCMQPIDTPKQQITDALSDTTYIEKGAWTGLFKKPRAIIYGVDQLFYVADTYNNRVVMLNQAGQILSIRENILHPIALAQDSRLDLLVGAEYIEPTTNDTIGIILRIHLVKNKDAVDPANHNLALSKIDTVWKEPARPKRRFVGIAIMNNGSNEYLVARDGPDNTSVVDPDARVMHFKYVKVDSVNYVDRYLTPRSELQTGQGSSITSINHPTGIATFPRSADFVLTQTSDGVQYSAIWMTYSKTNDFEGWMPKYDPSISNVDFIRPNRFTNAQCVTIDASRNIYIVDATQDSIVKFTSLGRFKAESFGAKTPGITIKHPQGAAVAEKTLYVCDTENDRIVLYRLSSDN